MAFRISLCSFYHDIDLACKYGLDVVYRLKRIEKRIKSLKINGYLKANLLTSNFLTFFQIRKVCLCKYCNSRPVFFLKYNSKTCELREDDFLQITIAIKKLLLLQDRWGLPGAKMHR